MGKFRIVNFSQSIRLKNKLCYSKKVKKIFIQFFIKIMVSYCWIGRVNRGINYCKFSGLWGEVEITIKIKLKK